MTPSSSTVGDLDVELLDERVRDLPPSCKVVFLVLDDADGPLTRTRLAAATSLPEGTLKDALRRLDNAGVLERRTHLSDNRQTTYGIHPGTND